MAGALPGRRRRRPGQPAALLTRHDAAGFAAVRDGGRAVAIGRGTLDAGWLGVTAVEVEPAARRAGPGRCRHGRAVGVGRRRGAVRSYLQVSSDNAGAVALYRAEGYWVHHDYRYRTEPVG